MLQVVLEHGQTRVKQKPVAGLVGPEDWDYGTFVNCVQEEITGDVILMPRCWEEGFYTSNVAPYDKLGLADFTSLTAASGAAPGWIEHDPTGVGGGRYLMAPAGFGETATTLESYSQNQAFHLSWFSYGEGSDFEVIRCGWGGTPGEHTAGVALRFFASHKVQLWKNGEFVGEGSLKGSGGGTLQNTRIGVMLLPCRFRELLIVASNAEGFLHAFDDIAPTDTAAAITPAGKFWVSFPSGGTPDFQLAPLKFATSGTAESLPSAFKRPPALGALPAFRAFHFGGTAPVVSLPGFTPDNNVRDFRIRVELSGDGSTTPFLRGATAQYPAITGQTPALNLDLNPFITRMNFAVPDDAGGVEATLTVKSPARLEEMSGARLRAIGNMPVSIGFGGLRILDGRTDGPEWEEALEDQVRRMTIPIRDAWKTLERTIVDDPTPLDGMTFRNALRWLLEYCALYSASGFDVPEVATEIPFSPSEDWGTLIESGDSCAEWIRRLCDTYAANWLYGFKPGVSGITFYAKPPAGFGTAPKLTLYTTYDAALLAYGENARSRWLTSFKENVLEPEGNELYVTGMDPGTGRPIVRVVRDTASIDPTLAITARPRNWQGEVLTVGYYDPSLNTDEAVEGAAELMGRRVMSDRRLTQFGCEMLFYNAGLGTWLPIWRGDVVRIVNPAVSPVSADYLIRSLTCDRFKDIGWDQVSGNDNPFASRPTTYVAEEIIA
jgi:hypothetical protein